MHIICKCQIDFIFDEVLNDRISREEISSWASTIISSEEKIYYLPSDAEEIIWDALIFLMGIDLKDSPDDYLHNKKDIINNRLNI